MNKAIHKKRAEKRNAEIANAYTTHGELSENLNQLTDVSIFLEIDMIYKVFIVKHYFCTVGHECPCPKRKRTA